MSLTVKTLAVSRVATISLSRPFFRRADEKNAATQRVWRFRDALITTFLPLKLSPAMVVSKVVPKGS